MKAWVIAIGNEVLSGKVINTNSTFIASFLNKYQIIIEKMLVISDDENKIIEAIRDFQASDCRYLITTGGLGPTHEDLTRQAISYALARQLVLSDIAQKKLVSYFGEMKNDCNIQQLYIPEGAVTINNLTGTANGFYIVEKDQVIISLVGVPYEMETMLKEVEMIFEKETTTKYSEYTLMGRSESQFENILQKINTKHPNFNFALYCSPETVRLQVVCGSQQELIKFDKILQKNLFQYIIGKDDTVIEEVVVEWLKKLKFKISCAESCTGGMIASTLINVDGASEIIKESYITYANDAKIQLLNVKPEIINQFGPASRETVMAMVNGLYQKTKANVCLAVSGYTDNLSNGGEVYFAILISDILFVQKQEFHGSRNIVRLRATKYILYQLLLLLKKEGKDYGKS